MIARILGAGLCAAVLTTGNSGLTSGANAADVSKAAAGEMVNLTFEEAATELGA